MGVKQSMPIDTIRRKSARGKAAVIADFRQVLHVHALRHIRAAPVDSG
jgi:hypothetical protein